MTTIKLKYQANNEFFNILKNIRKQYSIVLKFSYNRLLEDMPQIEIRKRVKSLKNIDLINSWIIQSAIMEAIYIHKKFKNKVVIFGGKTNLLNRVKNKITKQEFQEKRLSSLNIQGEARYNGNRMFNLNIIEDNTVTFKLNKNTHFELVLPYLRNNYKKLLFKLQELNEKDGYTYSVRLDENYIYFSFEEFKSSKILNLYDNRYIGIDLNPDSIGVSVFENDIVIQTKEWSLKQIFDKFLSETLSSNDKKSKYYQNKLKFETYEIAKNIENLCKEFKCKFVFIEELNFKFAKTNKYNNVGNRKNKNLWKRNLLVENLKKRCSINNMKLFEVNPAYTSYIGNLKYDYTDPINASIEIGRRGYNVIILKNKKFYPDFDLSSLKHRWKEMVNDGIKNWKDLFSKIKNSKLKYRVSLDECKRLFDVFSLNSSDKSLVKVYDFY